MGSSLLWLFTLLEIGSPPASTVPLLMVALNDPEPRIRTDAIDVLVELRKG